MNSTNICSSYYQQNFMIKTGAVLSDGGLSIAMSSSLKIYMKSADNKSQ